jgi:Ca2+-binding EF-hand superfamily protein
MFSAMVQHNTTSSIKRPVSHRKSTLQKPSSQKTEVNFKQFLIVLSSLIRGTSEDKIKWLFNFYDIDCDGKISHDVNI